MPKNQFQRPLPVARAHNVPRHGAPLPVRNVDVKKVALPPHGPAALPPLEALLGRPTR